MNTLRAVKVVHTVVWAFFAGCILAIPVMVWRGESVRAKVLVAIVLLEVTVLAINKCRCPLTSVAAHYTADRRDNFDIYLPEWLARYNKVIFGLLFVAGTAFAFARSTLDDIRLTEDMPTRLRTLATVGDRCLARFGGHIGTPVASCVCATVARPRLNCLATKDYLAFFDAIPLRQERYSAQYYGLAYLQDDSPPRDTVNFGIMGDGVLIEDRIGLPPRWYLLQMCRDCD